MMLKCQEFDSRLLGASRTQDDEMGRDERILRRQELGPVRLKIMMCRRESRVFGRQEFNSRSRGYAPIRLRTLPGVPA